MTQGIFITLILLATIVYFRCGKPGTGSKQKFGYGFSLKNDSLYFHDRLLEQVDITSFSVLDEAYARDKNHVYFFSSKRQSKDYFTTKKISFEIVESTHTEKFTALGYGYGKDDTKGYYEGQPFEIKDAPSFELLDHHWMKDAIVAYVDRKELKGSDGQSFELLSSPYARDKNHVYYGEGLHDGHIHIKILSKRPSNFSLLEPPYARDDHNVFYFADLIEGADPLSIQILDAGYSKDKNQAYFQNQAMKVSDVASFFPSKENENFTGSGAFARDKQYVYFQDQIMPEVDLASFAILNEFYSKDKNAVFFKTSKVAKADPESFSVFPHDMGDTDAKDKNHNFYQGKLVSDAE